MLPLFVDTHCHFDVDPFCQNETQSLALAAAAGVEKIITVGVSVSRFAAIIALVNACQPLYAALGIHPFEVTQYQESDLAQLENWLRQRPEKLVAVGEVGLDLFMPTPYFARQQALLEAQLVLAKRYDLPVILHSRRAHDKLVMLLRRHNLPRGGVVHGFAGSEQQARAFIRAGYAIGVGGTLTYERAAKTRRALACLPLTSLLLETDSPYMPLQGFQGQPNRPERIKQIWQSLCDLRDEPPQAIAEILRQNTRNLFGI